MADSGASSSSCLRVLHCLSKTSLQSHLHENHRSLTLVLVVDDDDVVVVGVEEKPEANSHGS